MDSDENKTLMAIMRTGGKIEFNRRIKRTKVKERLSGTALSYTEKFPCDR